MGRLLRMSGLALVTAGVLMAVATLLHPSRETATTIIASEAGLIAAHVAYTLSWLLVLLGLPGLYAAQGGRTGRLGLTGFLIAFTGTYLIAVTGNFGFLAPVLARNSSTRCRFEPAPVEDFEAQATAHSLRLEQVLRCAGAIFVVGIQRDPSSPSSKATFEPLKS